MRLALAASVLWRVSCQAAGTYAVWFTHSPQVLNLPAGQLGGSTFGD